MNTSNKRYTIYKLIFPDGRFYIGRTSDFNKRLANHKCNTSDYPVNKAINEFGFENVKVSRLNIGLEYDLAVNIESHLISSNILNNKCLNVLNVNPPTNKTVSPDIQKLKRVYDAARQLNGHNQDEAAEVVGKSSSMINQTLSGTSTSQPTIDAVLNYCYKSGLEYTIKKHGLDPDQPAKSNKATATA